MFADCNQVTHYLLLFYKNTTILRRRSITQWVHIISRIITDLLPWLFKSAIFLTYPSLHDSRIQCHIFTFVVESFLPTNAHYRQQHCQKETNILVDWAQQSSETLLYTFMQSKVCSKKAQV